MTTDFTTQKIFRTLPGHAKAEPKFKEGDISITLASLLAAVRPNKQVSLEPLAEGTELTRIARSYLAGLGSVN